MYFHYYFLHYENNNINVDNAIDSYRADIIDGTDDLDDSDGMD